MQNINTFYKICFYISEKISTFAAQNNKKTHNNMINSKVISVSVDIAAQIFCDFEAIKIESKVGTVLMQFDSDKKNAKKNLCIAFYPEQNQIMLKNGGFYHALNVISGNLNEFVGEYEIEFFGKKGLVTIK